MTAAMPWFRMYTDFLNDSKMIALSFEDQRHFIGLLALKADGVLDQDCRPDLMDRIVAQRLWIDHAIIREVKRRLQEGGLIDDGWQPLGWDARQAKSDSSAERTRRYRERQRGQVEGVSTDGADDGQGNQPASPDSIDGDDDAGDEDVTSPSRHCDGLDKRREEEKREEKKKNKPSAQAQSRGVPPPPPSVSQEVWDDFVRHRKAKRAPLTDTAVKQLSRELVRAAEMGWMPDDALAEAMAAGWQSLKADWLTNRVAGSRPQAGSAPRAQPNRQEALEARNRQAADEWLRSQS